MPPKTKMQFIILIIFKDIITGKYVKVKLKYREKTQIQGIQTGVLLSRNFSNIQICKIKRIYKNKENTIYKYKRIKEVLENGIF